MLAKKLQDVISELIENQDSIRVMVEDNVLGVSDIDFVNYDEHANCIVLYTRFIEPMKNGIFVCPIPDNDNNVNVGDPEEWEDKIAQALYDAGFTGAVVSSITGNTTRIRDIQGEKRNSTC